MNKLKPCPFCGCSMGVLEIGNSFQCFGRHKSACILKETTGGSYGRLSDMVEAWNTRSNCVSRFDTTRWQTCAYLHDGQKIVLKRDVKTGAAWLEIQPQAEIKPQ